MLPHEMNLRRMAMQLKVQGFDRYGHDFPKMPPLMHAIRCNQSQMVELLLEWGADITETGGSCRLKANTPE